MYATTSTRPDVCYVVGLISKYQSNPNKEHWQVVQRTLKYLQGTKNLNLCFKISDLEIIIYSNADFGSDVNNKKFTSGLILLFSETTISLLCKKQCCVAESIIKT